jgi:hypothetical protein
MLLLCDEDIATICNPDASLDTQDQALDTQAQVYEGPVTRRHAKKIQQEVHVFLF